MKNLVQKERKTHHLKRTLSELGNFGKNGHDREPSTKYTIYF